MGWYYVTTHPRSCPLLTSLSACACDCITARHSVSRCGLSLSPSRKLFRLRENHSSQSVYEPPPLQYGAYESVQWCMLQAPE